MLGNRSGEVGKNFSGGFFDYNDLATASTPISVVGGAGFIDLTNDELGAFTNKTYAPQGISDVWDASNNQFDWSQLVLGDMVDIRLDVNIITANVNTEVTMVLELALGGIPYNINWFNPTNFKNSVNHHIVKFNGVYMGDNNTLNNPAKFGIKADKTCTIIVNGWYCKIIKVK